MLFSGQGKHVMGFARLVTSLLLFMASQAAGAGAADSTDWTAQWSRLLHMENGTSRVVSPGFFVAEEGGHDPQSELRKFLHLLSGSQAIDVACQFPARYLLVRQKFVDTPEIDLQSCRELQDFVTGFQHQSLFLIFASEFLNVPSSSFGHVLLLARDPTQAEGLGDAIHFSAETGDEGFFEYAYSGVSGTYPGYFQREAFFNIRNNYTVIEQRFLHLYQLNLSARQAMTLVYHLFELRKAKFRYYFVRENCAFQIAALLGVVYQRDLFSERGYALPIHVVEGYRDTIINHRVIAPTMVVAKSLLDQMSESELSDFDQVLSGDSESGSQASERVKEALVRYYEYRFRAYGEVLPNYRSVMDLAFAERADSVSVPDPLGRPKPGKLGVGVTTTPAEDRFYLQIRPFLQDRFDLLADGQQESELLFFNTELEGSVDDIEIKRLDIVTLRSHPFRGKYFKPYSWDFSLALNRSNRTGELMLNPELGLGVTYVNAGLITSYSLGAGLDANGDKVDGYVKPEIQAVTRLGRMIKVGLRAYEKRNVDSHFSETTVFLTLQGRTQSLNVEYADNSGDVNREFRVVFAHHF